MTAAGNAAQVASGKRKGTGDDAGCSSKRVALDLFPTHPNYDSKGGLNIQLFSSSPNSGQCQTNMQSVPQLETQEDPFDRLFKSQVRFTYSHLCMCVV